MSKPKIVTLMFASEKLVCSSAKTEREVYEAVYKLKRILGEVNVMELSFPLREKRFLLCNIVEVCDNCGILALIET